MAKRKAPIETIVRTPLPASVVATLGSLIEAAWPGTGMGAVPGGHNPEGICVDTPVEVAEVLLPVLQAAFEQNPDAQNYVEMPISDSESGRTFLLTFCRSAGQTPHELRAAAEEKLLTTRSEISQAHTRALQRLLMVPRADSPDTYAAGVKAALNAIREQNFGRQDLDE